MTKTELYELVARLTPDRLKEMLELPTDHMVLMKDRVLIINTCLQVMRDEQDAAVRKRAYDLLMNLRGGITQTLEDWHPSDYAPGRWGDN